MPRLVAETTSEQTQADLANELVAQSGGAPMVILISAESQTEFADLVYTNGVLGFISKSDLSGEAIRELTDSHVTEG